MQEISFSKGDREQTNIKTIRNFEEKDKNIVRNQWDNIKDEYNSLSQNKDDYKKKKKNYKYDEEDEEDAKSVSSAKSATSVLSNFTDISHIKQIHIKEIAKNKKPSFF